MLKDESYKFIGQPYKIGNVNKMLSIGDEVVIHPVPGVSQAVKSYPAIIVEIEINMIKYGKSVRSMQLCLMGIEDNAGWHGAIINEYAFNRLEFKCAAIHIPSYVSPSIDKPKELI